MFHLRRTWHKEIETFALHLIYRSNRSFNMPLPPPGIPRAFDTFAVPGSREFDYQSLLGGGEFDPHALGGGEFELHHVKSLAWRPIMGDAVLEDFRGKDCAFVANCLRGKGLNKLCVVFEVFKF